eukprot:1274939-Amphidinium_carterae.1
MRICGEDENMVCSDMRPCFPVFGGSGWGSLRIGLSRLRKHVFCSSKSSWGNPGGFVGKNENLHEGHFGGQEFARGLVGKNENLHKGILEARGIK